MVKGVNTERGRT